MPVLPPSEVTFPDKKQLLRGREIRLARRQDRLQRFGAMMSGAAAAAVLFGGMFLFNPNRPGKGQTKWLPKPLLPTLKEPKLWLNA